MVNAFVIMLAIGAVGPAATLGGGPSHGPVMVAQATPSDAVKPRVVETQVITVRGTVEAIDKEKKTVTLKGPKRSLTIQVRDPQKLEMIKVGDPVVAKYYEALAIEVKKPGEATPGVSTQQMTVSSKPGETPAGAVGEQITATVTATAIDKKAGTITVKGPEGNTETIKARDPKNLDKIKVGDLVEVTYTRALAVSLEKSAKK